MSRCLLALVLAGCLFVPAAGQPLELFVKNRPFDGQVRELEGELYAPLAELLQSLGCSWSVEESALVVDTSTAGGGPPLTQAYPTILVDGRPVRVNQHRLGGDIYVGVGELAQAVGAVYRKNHALGTADLYAPLAAGGGGGGSTVMTDGQGKNSPLVVEKLSYSLEPDPESGSSLMRGYVVLRNRSDSRPVERVVIRVEVVDGVGRPCGRFAGSYAQLKPGERVTYQFPVWANHQSADRPHPVVQLEHQRL
ncbi:MAG: hypothetical protein HY319_06610 [Armatimonadetes bacterium]|nr:hypothetical protein [Armatimonadota bacterium]